MRLVKVGELGHGEFEDIGETTLHNFFEIVPGFAESVIGETILGEVVGFYFFGTHSGANGKGAFIG